MIIIDAQTLADVATVNCRTGFRPGSTATGCRASSPSSSMMCIAASSADAIAAVDADVAGPHLRTRGPGRSRRPGRPTARSGHGRPRRARGTRPALGVVGALLLQLVEHVVQPRHRVGLLLGQQLVEGLAAGMVQDGLGVRLPGGEMPSSGCRRRPVDQGVLRLELVVVPRRCSPPIPRVSSHVLTASMITCRVLSRTPPV